MHLSYLFSGAILSSFQIFSILIPSFSTMALIYSKNPCASIFLFFKICATLLKYSIRLLFFKFLFASSISASSSLFPSLNLSTACLNFPDSSLSIFIPLIVNPNLTLVRSFMLLKSSKSKMTLYSSPVNPTT